MANNGLVYDKDADVENSPIKHAKSNDQDSENNKSLGSSSLNESENGGLYKPDDSVSPSSDSEASDTLGRGFTGNGKGALKSRLLSSRRNKMILLGLGGSGAGAVLVVVLLLLIASSLKIPNLAQHITSYEFARITRQFSENAQRITSEKLVLSSALDSSTVSFADQVKAKFPSLAKASDTLAKLDSYRPENVIKTLGQDNNLRLNFTNNKFTGSTLDGTTFSMKSAGTFTGKVPLLRDVIDFKGQLQFSKDFVPALDSAMKLNDVGPIIRGATARQVRQRLGIGLIAWNLGKYQGKNPVEARLQELRDKIKAVGQSEAKNQATTEILKDTTDKVSADIKAAESSDKALQGVIDNGGVLKSSQAIIDSSLSGSVFQKALGFANPIYGMALPLCIIYDGSMSSSGDTINNNTKQQQAAFYYIATAADQQKQGSINSADDQNLAAAVNATNADLGNISDTTPEVRAAGGVIDTQNAGISAEAGANGQFTLFDATLGSNAFSKFVDTYVTPSCKVLTRTDVALGVLVGNAFISFFGGPEVPAAEVAAEATTNVVVNKVTQSITERLVSKVVGKEIVFSATKTGKVTKYLLENVKSVGKIVGATVVAKLYVLSQSGLLNGGFSQGEDLANMAASGGNIQANELSRQQLFGRPLTNAETAQSDQVDSQFIAYQNQSKSFTDRYLATSNVDSLISHMAMGVSATFHSGFMTSLIKLGGYILQPFTHFGALFGSLFSSVHAAPDPSTQHYGNVQFGWSQAEENLINNDGSYQPLENQAILDAATGPDSEISIAQKYAQCFGYTADDSGKLLPVSSNSGTGTLGDLLSSGKIIRDGVGNVLVGSASDSDSYVCSPYNLGKPMVMRWRLAMSYGTTLDQLTAMQNVTN